MLFLFWGDWTLLIILPALIFSIVAQIHVQRVYTESSAIGLPYGMSGGLIARRILDSNHLPEVNIETVRGELSDHYDPRKRVLRLSENVYRGENVAAVGVAAHEAAHAMQHAKRYFPLSLRMVLAPVCSIGSGMAMPLFFIGLLLSYFLPEVGEWVVFAGLAAYALVVVFQLITLPVEFNASNRAMRCLTRSGTMSEAQLKGTRRVLNAAAMTYVASLTTGLFGLFRLLVLASGLFGRRRK